MKKTQKETLEKLKEFYNEIKKLVRNTGRSSMISIQEIEKLIVNVGKIE